MLRIVVKLIQYGDFLSTRAIGADVRGLVETALAANDSVVVDFYGIEGISNSFADEFLGRLALEHGVDNLSRSVRIRNANELVSLVLRGAIGRRVPAS